MLSDNRITLLWVLFHPWYLCILYILRQRVQFEKGGREEVHVSFIRLFLMHSILLCDDVYQHILSSLSAPTSGHPSRSLSQPHSDRAGKGLSRNPTIKISRATRVSEQWNASLDREITNANELRHLDEFLGNQVNERSQDFTHFRTNILPDLYKWTLLQENIVLCSSIGQ